MKPSGRRDAPVDDLLREERERWERVADAKTPEDLHDALRKQKPPRRNDWRSAIFPLVVTATIAWLAINTLASSDGPPDPAATPPIPGDVELPIISPRSTGPVIAVPNGNVVAIVSSRGSEPRPVTPLGEGAREPVWRPDGGALLVSARDGLVELAVDRAGTPQWSLRRRLGDYRGVSAVYAPDGERVAYIAVLADIVVGDRGGSRPRRVADLVEGREPLQLDWSRHDRLAVAAGGAIYVLTSRGEIVREVLAALPTAAMPAWSPDGRRLAYTQLNMLGVRVTHPASRTPPGAPVGPPGGMSAYPAWAPDGRAIAYARFVDGTWDRFVYDFASKRERRLTRGPGDEIDPAWSPDGKQIAFVGSGL